MWRRSRCRSGGFTGARGSGAHLLVGLDELAAEARASVLHELPRGLRRGIERVRRGGRHGERLVRLFVFSPNPARAILSARLNKILNRRRSHSRARRHTNDAIRGRSRLLGDSSGAMFMFEPGYKDFDPTKEEKRDRPPYIPTPDDDPDYHNRKVGRPKPPAEDDELAAFEACSRKILDEFGEVHHNLGLNQKGNRGLCAVGPIKNGEIIFGIPECICYTAAGALKDERIGPFIDAHTAPSKPKRGTDGDDDGGEKGKVKGKVKGETASILRMPRGDVALAMRVTFDALHMRSTIQYSTWAPYHWLLDREDFDESPTWWDDATREKLLKGSHVLELARKAAEDFEHDWNVVKDELADMAVEAKLYPLIPTDFLRETFRRAVAAIHSRSFNAAVPGQETSDAAEESEHTILVPVLDCANHHRKPRECRWEIVPIENWERRRHYIGKWSVVVGALRDFDEGDPIRIAYGARSNSELLVRYGFTVPDNAEPDGSSNDVVPLHIPGVPGGAVAQLRVASRPGYTYPPLASALDAIKRKRLGVEEPSPGEKTRVRTDDDIVGELDELDDWYGGNAGGGDGDDEDDEAMYAEMYGGGDGDDGDDGDDEAMYAEGTKAKRARAGEKEDAVDVVDDMRRMDDPYGGVRSLTADDVDEEDDDDEGAGGEARGSLDVEVAALRDLVAILRERRDAIPEELTRHDGDDDADRRAAAAATQMLSERLTLSFYLDATERALAIAAGVVNGSHETLREAVRAAELGGEGGGDAPPAGTEGADAMAWRCGRLHVDTLVRAYFRIRHGVA